MLTNIVVYLRLWTKERWNIHYACYIHYFIHIFSFQTRQTNHLLYKVKNVLSVSLAMLAESLWCCSCLFTRKLTRERVSTQNSNRSQFTHPLLGILQIHHPPPTAPNPLFVSSLTYRATDPAVQHSFSWTLNVILNMLCGAHAQNSSWA